MKYIIGIGNPGKKYQNTRHNIGFDVVLWLGKRVGAGLKPVRWEENKVLKADIFESESALFIKPLTFVNKTGDVVSAILKRNGAKPQDFLILCDDVNLEFGKIRLRSSGSAGGHHGLESVIEALGSEDFSRLRIGVGTSEMPVDLTGYVLEKFSSAELKKTGEIIEKASQVGEAWITSGFEQALNQLSRLQSVT